MEPKINAIDLLKIFIELCNSLGQGIASSHLVAKTQNFNAGRNHPAELSKAFRQIAGNRAAKSQNRPHLISDHYREKADRSADVRRKVLSRFRQFKSGPIAPGRNKTRLVTRYRDFYRPSFEKFAQARDRF
jgi:hypothetical protein